MTPSVYLYSDGSCLGNPGPGGYAVILEANGRSRTVSGGVPHTTNNRMELQAVIAGLAALKRRCQVTVVTDSRYVATILAGGRARANRDLVGRLRHLAEGHQVQVAQVAAHSGHPQNETADTLARAAARQAQQEVASCVTS